MFKTLPYVRHNDFDVFDGFDTFFRPFNDESDMIMKTDVKEDNGNFVLDIEIPGFDKSEIELQLEKGYLRISATKTENKEEAPEGQEKKVKYLRRERRLGTMSRSYYVGSDLKEEDIKATYKDGVLTVSFPKECPKKIEERKIIAIQ